jgi:hypothetical protein
MGLNETKAEDIELTLRLFKRLLQDSDADIIPGSEVHVAMLSRKERERKRECQLVGSLTTSYDFKEGGLVKKVSSSSHHVFSRCPPWVPSPRLSVRQQANQQRSLHPTVRP